MALTEKEHLVNLIRQYTAPTDAEYDDAVACAEAILDAGFTCTPLVHTRTHGPQPRYRDEGGRYHYGVPSA